MDAEYLTQTEKFLRSRKCVGIFVIAIIVAMVIFILLVTNTIPIRDEKICKESKIILATEPFGKTKKGKDVSKYILKNSNGVEAQIINYGATLVSLKVPDKNGNIDDVVLGFDSISQYDDEHPFFGATVGRYANRIDKGSFLLDGVSYQLTKNDGENHLHGGIDNWSKRVWEGEINKDEGYVKLTIVSPDRDQGYPGKVTASVTYQLTKDNTLLINFTANTEGEATPINLCNHAYFNLAGHNKGSIYEHVAKLHANSYLPKTDDLIPTGEIADVSGTLFDLRRGKRLGDVLPGFPGGGYDNNFCLSGPTGKRFAATVTHSESGRRLDVYTNQPGVQFYTGNFLVNISGKVGAVYGRHNGFCLETQNYPDAPNQPNFPDSILRPGSTYMHQCWYSFSW